MPIPESITMVGVMCYPWTAFLPPPPPPIKLGKAALANDVVWAWGRSGSPREPWRRRRNAGQVQTTHSSLACEIAPRTPARREGKWIDLEGSLSLTHYTKILDLPKLWPPGFTHKFGWTKFDLISVCLSPPLPPAWKLPEGRAVSL